MLCKRPNATVQHRIQLKQFKLSFLFEVWGEMRNVTCCYAALEKRSKRCNCKIVKSHD